MIVGDWGDGVAHVVLTAWNDRFAGSLKLAMMFAMRFEDRGRLANYRELIGGVRRPADHVGAELARQVKLRIEHIADEKSAREDCVATATICDCLKLASEESPWWSGRILP